MADDHISLSNRTLTDVLDGVNPQDAATVAQLGAVTTSLEVTDGGTTVDPTSSILLSGGGLSLADLGGGQAEITFAGTPGPPGPAAEYAKVSDQKSVNTDGGTFTSGAWQTRTLNTEDSDDSGFLALSSNQVTLSAGTYIVRASAPAVQVNVHQTRLMNVTDNSVIIVGTSEFAGATGVGVTRSWVCGKFTIGASKALELQHRAITTKATNGFGAAATFTTEVYAEMEFWKQ